MRKTGFILLVVCSTLAVVQAGEKKAHFLLDFRPGSFLLAPDLDGFTVHNAGNTYFETVSGVGSWTPSLNAGLGLNFNVVDLNITAGPGYLWNGAFRGPFWQADVGVLFKAAHGHFRIGPHVGLLGLGDATWDSIDSSGYSSSGDPQVDLQGNTGFKAGLTLHAGGDKVAFLANIDFVDAKYDVTTTGGWVAQDDEGTVARELDMSGMMIDLGVIFRF
jgi:hypothetical protein